MKAVRYHDYGGPDVLCYEDAPIPEPGPREVLGRVQAAGVRAMGGSAFEAAGNCGPG
jgi:NADPH:quinone reductase-like Zn-dependent oxidoreductase